MKKQDISVDELVKMIERQELQLPEIQRQYVWQAPRVRDLLDSLYRGYPSGTVLVWETDQPVPTRAVAVTQTQTAFEGQKLLLDGQQRLTSLTAVLSGKTVQVRGRKKPIDILFNLEHPDGPPVDVTEIQSDSDALLTDGEDQGDDPGTEEEEEDGVQDHVKRRTFVVGSRTLAGRPNWVSVTKVFGGATDAELLKNAGVKSFDDPRYGRYMERLTKLRRIRQYPYVMHVLNRDLSYEEVAEIFVRVNSLGVKLRSSDLALAQITARWRNFLAEIEKFQEECEKHWFTLDTGLLVRTMIVFATRQAKFQRAGSVPLAMLQQAWEEAKHGLRFAVSFLQNNAGIEDETILSAPTLIIPIAVFSRLRQEKLTADERRELLYWLHVANARGRYSRGSSETLLNEDLTILFKGGTPNDLLDPIKRLFGRLNVLASDLAGRPSVSPLFPLTYLTLKQGGARDWESGLGISLAAMGKQHLIQYHHIFPKAVLREANYEAREINEIANLAFIGARSNQRIGRKPPAEYFPTVIAKQGKEALESQYIPLDPELWKVQNYPEFLRVRRELLSEAINTFIDSQRGAVGGLLEPVGTPT